MSEQTTGRQDAAPEDPTGDPTGDTADSTSGGSGMGLAPDEEPDEGTVREIEEDRERRLDPENRPDGAEVDNTQRDFDVERGRFTDSEQYDEADPAPFSDPEDPNNPDGSAQDAAPSETES